MLNKNFNRLLSGDLTTGNPVSPDCNAIDGTTSSASTASLRNISDVSTYENLDSSIDGSTGLFLFTETFNETIETYTVPTEYTNYSVTVKSINSLSSDVVLSYSRTIMPIEDGLIKSIGIIINYAKPVLIAFENLAEPVQLTAGEPHTFTFTIKVWHILDKLGWF